MPPDAGLLIAFDGVDSSGKETQTKLLVDGLKSQGHTVLQFTTPDYSTPSGQRLKALLQATDGAWEKLSNDEKIAAFTTNRAEHRDEVHAALAAGHIVIYDRYVASSLTHRVVDFLASHEATARRQEVIDYVSKKEYDDNNMPRENLSIFLDVPPAVAARLLVQRKQLNADADEITDSLELQQRLYDEYIWLTARNPNRYLRVACVQAGQLLPKETIAKSIWSAILKRFPEINHV